MTKAELEQLLTEFIEKSPLNRLAEEDAIYPNLAGLKFFEAPLLGFSSADDELYTKEFKKEGVVSPEYMAPSEWLPEAKTVISFFVPFTDEVKTSNKTKDDIPYEDGLPQRSSAEWLHARIEGQGLGTFGLSKGLITKKGMAGRFGSVITDAAFEADVRPYSNPFEYCTMCGACQRRCPAHAIDKEKGCALGKDQNICGPFVEGSHLPPHGPRAVKRYGCGKCQVAVPCESGIPGRK